MRKVLTIIIVACMACGTSVPSFGFEVSSLEYYPGEGECELLGFAEGFSPTGPVAVVIPDVIVDEKGKEYKVTSVASHAFAGYPEITEVVFGLYIRKIGAHAFRSCINIEELVIPASVKEIGSEAFAGCIALKSLFCGAEVIGDNAFDSCVCLSDITLAFPIKYIEPGAFKGCVALTWVDLPFTVERIGSGNAYTNTDGVFELCVNLVGISFFGNLYDDVIKLERIGDNTFKDCLALERFEVPKSVTYIGTNAFIRCLSLKHLEWGGESRLQVAPQDFTSVPLKKIIFHGNVAMSATDDIDKLTDLMQIRYDSYADEVQPRMFRGLSKLKEVHLTSVAEIGSIRFMTARLSRR